MPTAAVGRPTRDPRVIPSIDFFCKTRICVCAHSSNWSAKVVECSEPSFGFFIGIFCKTHMCVCSQQQLVGQPSVDLFCSTRSAKVFKLINASIDLLCTRHVCIQRHTCLCPQQQLSFNLPDTLYKFRVIMHRAESPCIEREICTAFVCHLFCRFEGPREVPNIVAFVCHVFAGLRVHGRSRNRCDWTPSFLPV